MRVSGSLPRPRRSHGVWRHLSLRATVAVCSLGGALTTLITYSFLLYKYLDTLYRIQIPTLSKCSVLLIDEKQLTQIFSWNERMEGTAQCTTRRHEQNDELIALLPIDFIFMALQDFKVVHVVGIVMYMEDAW